MIRWALREVDGRDTQADHPQTIILDMQLGYATWICNLGMQLGYATSNKELEL
jgi:hypothetical protein